MTAPSVQKTTGCLVVVAALLFLTPAVFGSAQLGHPGKSTAPNPNANQFGELSAVWWQWVFSFPVTTNPNFSSGFVDCSYGQSSHSRSNQIWFLAGSFGGTADRTCTTPIPRGIALFLPLLNAEWDNIGCCEPTTPPFNLSIQQLKQFVASTQDGAQLYATVDGVSVPIYRAQSPVFSYTLPEIDNVYNSGALGVSFTLPGTNWPSTTVFPVVSDGYWVMLENLPPGPHEIKFGGIANNGFSVNITYHVTVAP